MIEPCSTQSRKMYTITLHADIVHPKPFLENGIQLMSSFPSNIYTTRHIRHRFGKHWSTCLRNRRSITEFCFRAASALKVQTTNIWFASGSGIIMDLDEANRPTTTRARSNDTPQLPRAWLIRPSWSPQLELDRRKKLISYQFASQTAAYLSDILSHE